ncbi:hypothetical protein LCGC14_0628090 [marine sediment metagenome]|uniref:Uncharacterized protein n=1 Tax=marine sediment metagenome TaxID=412755 RepID=A0A0F9R7X3_9ZZZZ
MSKKEMDEKERMEKADREYAEKLDKLIPGESKRTTVRKGGSRTFDTKGVEILKNKSTAPKTEGGEK